MNTATITSATLARIANLTAFVATGVAGTMSPSLAGVMVNVAHGELNAYATDRISGARYTTTAPAQDFLPQVILSAKLLTGAARSTKDAASVHLMHDEDQGTVTIDWVTGRASETAMTGNFPPLERLFHAETSDIPQGTTFDPQFLARLAKLTRKGKRLKDRAIPFALSGSGDTGRHGPMLLATGDGYAVLLCPTTAS